MTVPFIGDEAVEQFAVMAHDGDGLLVNLDRAARELEQKGAGTLLIVPGALPTIGAADLDACLAGHRDGLTICPAERDGGTNVLAVSPPTGIGFRFGEQSCAKHVEAAATAGLDYRIEDIPAFRHDIDVPSDLAWLCGTPPQGRTGRFIARTGLAKRIRNATGHPPSAAIA